MKSYKIKKLYFVRVGRAKKTEYDSTGVNNIWYKDLGCGFIAQKKLFRYKLLTKASAKIKGPNSDVWTGDYFVIKAEPLTFLLKNQLFTDTMTLAEISQTERDINAQLGLQNNYSPVQASSLGAPNNNRSSNPKPKKNKTTSDEELIDIEDDEYYKD